jgi:hypothetical protein
MAQSFALGTAYSHLGRRAEAAEQFQWVVNRGDPVQDYHRAARQVTQLPLSATNSKVTPDEFPGPAPK